MEITVFGLSISSAWGNGHATLLRGLFRALHKRGHRVRFFEKDVPYYAAHRDAIEFPFVELTLYEEFTDVIGKVRHALQDSDVAIVTSYCPDGAIASELVLESGTWRKVFYDMDTPVTLMRLDEGERVSYLPESGLRGFDLVLSYTGGEALKRLQADLGARRTEALYGWVDPDSYYQVPVDSRFSGDFSYLGTYSADRQRALEELFLKPAASLPGCHFVLGGAMYADRNGWPGNVKHYEHIAPADHCEFYSSCPATLNITRGAMAAMGYCPSGRLFEAAACGAAVVSDNWVGLDEFFTPGEEILIASTTEEVVKILREDPAGLRKLAERAKKRALECHTADIRAERLLELIESSTANESVLECAGTQGG